MAYKFLALTVLQAMAVDAVGVMDLVQRQNEPAACVFIPEIISACESVYPNFDNWDATEQAGCVCYSSTVWVPDRFDNSVLTCANYLKTADPQEYTSVAAFEGFCRSIGDVFTPIASVSTPAPKTNPVVVQPTSTMITTPPPTRAASTSAAAASSSSVNLATVPQCSGVINILNTCENGIQGFDNMPVGQQALCVCYNGNTWVPDVFDNDVSSCAQYVKTAVPSLYSVYETAVTFCSSVGDVANEGGGTTTVSAGVTKTPTLTTHSTTPTTSATSQKVLTTVVVVSSTPTPTSSKAGASSHAAQGGMFQNIFLGFVGVVIGALAWL